MAKNSGSLKSTIAVSLTNYLDAGAIVAGASGLTLWQKYLGLTEVLRPYRGSSGMAQLY